MKLYTIDVSIIMPDLSHLPSDMLLEALKRMDANSLIKLSHTTKFFSDEKPHLKAMAKSNQLWKKHLADLGLIDRDHDFSNWPEGSLHRAFVHVNTLLFKLRQIQDLVSDLFSSELSKAGLGPLSPLELALFTGDDDLFARILRDPKGYKNPFNLIALTPQLLAIAGYMGKNPEQFRRQFSELAYDQTFYDSHAASFIYPALSDKPQSKDFIFSFTNNFSQDEDGRIIFYVFVYYFSIASGNTDGFHAFLSGDLKSKLTEDTVGLYMLLAMMTANKELLTELFQFQWPDTLLTEALNILFPEKEKAQVLLMKAARRGEPEILQQLLEKWSWTMSEFLDKNDHRLLYSACRSGKIEMIKDVVTSCYNDPKDLEKALTSSPYKALKRVLRSGSVEAFEWLKVYFSDPEQFQRALHESDSLVLAACSGNTRLFKMIADQIDMKGLDNKASEWLITYEISEVIEASKSPLMLKMFIDYLIDFYDFSEIPCFAETIPRRSSLQEWLLIHCENNVLFSALKTGRVDLFEEILNMYLTDEQRQIQLGQCIDCLRDTETVPETLLFLMFKRCHRENKQRLFDAIQHKPGFQENPLIQAKLFYLLLKLDASFVLGTLNTFQQFKQEVRQGLNESYQALFDAFVALDCSKEEAIPQWEDLQVSSLQQPTSFNL